MPAGETISSPQDRVYAINPLHDPRWPEFVGRHPNASVFHTRGWLRALQVTYGYEPVGFTTSAPSETLNKCLIILYGAQLAHRQSTCLVAIFRSL